MPTRYLYLVRHAQRAPEQPGDDALESGITSVGVEQARMTAERFDRLPVSRIYCSPLRRAVQTADILAAKHPSAARVSVSGLTEAAPVLPRDFADAFASVKASEFAAMKRSADAAFRQVFAPAQDEDRHELVVSHGNILRYLLVRALDLPLDSWTRFDLLNCSVSVVVVERGRAWAAGVGDVGHLPPRLQTYVRDIAPHAF